MKILTKLVYQYFKSIKINQWVESQFIHPSRSYLPEKIKKKFQVTERNAQGRNMATIESKKGSTNIHIIYLHGGAYVLEANTNHWDFIRKLIKKASCKLTFFDYPLAPENTYKETFKYMDEAYQKITSAYPKDNFILMGDSAGAGLAFAFTQKLRDENHLKQPLKNVLISPWLDITMTHPEIDSLTKQDLILTKKGLKIAADNYACGDDQTQYLLSPINGNLEDLGEIHILYGTHEIFYPDCIKLKKLTENLKNYYFYEYPKMQHIWIILLIALSEGKKGLNKIVSIINSKKN